MAAQAVREETPCAMMRRQAKGSRREIKRLRSNIFSLEDDIAQLKRQPNPDQKAIAALEQRLASLKVQLEQDELSLDTLEQVISENC
ncbi:hypothetical protein [Streptomyces sp. 6N223]|uniref:hypothetical protein n=1 Tax=Streptomyces sp. 6N223 TaxID=3457412 RepID=UPI003FD4BE46